jgi:hypothetical protein
MPRALVRPRLLSFGSLASRLDSSRPAGIYTLTLRMRPEYLSQKLDRPLGTKDGGTLRTVLDARTYMLGLSKDRERSAQWQR